MQSKKVDWIIYLVATTFFMETLDSTVITTALPQMASDFGVSPVDVGIGITAYLLTLATCIPISGWVADRFGSKKVFILAIVLFTFASILCGLSENLTFFTCARILQGVGGALMVPVGRAIVLQNTQKDGLIRAISLITWPGLVGPVVGPAIGGFLTTYATWHWIFFINIPIGIIGIIFSFILLEEKKEKIRKPFDIYGFLLTGVALSSIIYAIELTRHIKDSQLEILGFTVLGVISGYCSIKHMKRSPHPMIDLSLLKIPTFTTTLWAGLFFRIAIATVPFLIPLFLQIGLGMDPFKAGLIVLSIFLGNLAMKTVTTPLLNKYGFKLVMMVNGAMIVVTFLLSACINENMQIGLIVVILFCGGLTRSLQFTSINTLSLADIPQEKISSASSVSGTAMQLSMALGIAIGSLTLTLVSLMHSGNIETPSVSDFRLALVLIAIFPIIGMIILHKLDSNAGISIRKLN